MDERIALVEALEKAQQERDNWRTSFDNERFRADKLKAHIDDMEPIRAAAEKLVRCKGRYHSEQNYRALAALFGVNTPDLPPLEHENVHYADAAEIEIAALRQRIAGLEFIRTSADKVQREFADELGCAGDNESILQAIEDLKQQAESRTVTVKLPPRVDSSNVPFAGLAWNYFLDEVVRRLTDAGIKWEAE
ncbi:hypothetical protein FMJ23_04150 [Klebsiella michiganensis]|nr:hypothetical protein [Klebsiella michiganensis]MBZ7417896.1 hypothetical protein [Klebsiella michiganensis]MBZ7604676.1 hypothetical protein [Klebsiella michiganensis]